MKISGVHEHAEYYPMLSDEQLDELAADIRENGQRQTCVYRNGALTGVTVHRTNIRVLEFFDFFSTGSFSRKSGFNSWTGREAMGTTPSPCF